MDTNPFDAYIEDAQAVVERVNDETGIEWDVEVRDTRVETTWMWDQFNKRDVPDYQTIDCPTMAFSTEGVQIEVFADDDGRTQIETTESGLTMSRYCDSIDDAVESVYDTVSQVGT